MRPHFNSHVGNPNNNQLQLNGANASAPQQQVMANPGNLGQIRPQFPLGMLNNPQLAMPPFTNPNAFFPPNQFFPFPNLALNNMPQLLANNAVNPSQFMPNGQLNVQNLVQNVAQLLQMQMMNCGPQNLGNFMNLPSGGGNNNGVVPQLINGNVMQQMNPNGMVPQPINGNVMQQMNPNGMVPQPINGNVMQQMNHNGVVPQSINGNVMQHMNNAPVMQDNGPHKAQQNQNDNLLSPGASTPKNNPGVANGVNNRNNNWRKPHNNNFTGNNRYDASQRGFGNRQFHHQQNAQGNFKFNNENQGKGNRNIGVKNLNVSNHSEQIEAVQKRPFIPNYTEKEIQQWREERKKHFPSKTNMEKKSKEHSKEADIADAEIKRKQLKEILAKQAELGVEVADIPSSYLLDSEQRTDGRQQNSNKSFGKRERFRKGKFNRNDRFSKRQRNENSYSGNQRADNNGFRTQKEPSLLKKLLGSEIKKDKKHLLQVFRFMVMNSFLESSPLKYPLVIVKETGDESKIVEVMKDAFEDGDEEEIAQEDGEIIE